MPDEGPSTSVADILRSCRADLRALELFITDTSSPQAERRVQAASSVPIFGRMVTFALQTLRGPIGEATFDAWYLPEQQKMRDDPLLYWFVEMRNKIEKRGPQQLAVAAHISSMRVDHYMKNPPPGATKFFVLDEIGGVGWEIQEQDGSTSRLYVDLPPEIAQAALFFPTVPDHHLGVAIADRSVGGVGRLYHAYLTELVNQAEARFLSPPEQ